MANRLNTNYLPLTKLSEFAVSDVSLDDNHLKIPSGTSNDRPGNPRLGTIRFNTTTDSFEFYSNVGWLSMGGLTVTGITPDTFNGEQGTVISITGTGFVAGSHAAFITSNNSVHTAGITTFVNNSTLTATTPKDFTISEGPLSIRVTTPSGGTATLQSALNCGNNPAWSTSAGSLGQVARGNTFSYQLSATDSDANATIQYSIVSGSLLSGLTLNSSTGNITGVYPMSVQGVAGGLSVASFTARATDNAGNYSDRAFSITGLNDYYTATFAYTGSDQTWKVPSNVYLIVAKLWGAGGGNRSTGGAGGYTEAEISVTPGENLFIMVGQEGSDSGGVTTSTYGGGGGVNWDSGWGGRQGGGRSAIRVGGADILTAGGGGGSGFSHDGYGGGGLVGRSSQPGSTIGGGAGTQTAGGPGGSGSGGTASAGSQYQGGAASTGTYVGGGGGGGFYGGGGSGGVQHQHWGGGGGSGFVGRNGANVLSGDEWGSLTTFGDNVPRPVNLPGGLTAYRYDSVVGRYYNFTKCLRGGTGSVLATNNSDIQYPGNVGGASQNGYVVINY